MWVIGGYDGIINRRGVWYTENGTTWQVKNNSIWQNAVSSNLLNGLNNDTLKLNFASIANSGQEYRCIVESGAYKDTTYASALNVLFPKV
jgi:hypothetical protein